MYLFLCREYVFIISLCLNLTYVISRFADNIVTSHWSRPFIRIWSMHLLNLFNYFLTGLYTIEFHFWNMWIHFVQVVLLFFRSNPHHDRKPHCRTTTYATHHTQLFIGAACLVLRVSNIISRGLGTVGSWNTSLLHIDILCYRHAVEFNCVLRRIRRNRHRFDTALFTFPH